MLSLNKLVRNFYIHIPFCIKKCHFCAFPIHAIGQLIAQDKKFMMYQQYCQKVIQQINLLSNDYKSMSQDIQSIYFGGGTPSLLKVQQVNSLLNNFRNGITKKTQITLQMNPQQIKKAQQFLKIGVNRLSVGIQSLNNKTLQKMNRGYITNSTSHKNDLKQQLKQLSKSTNINLDFIIDLNDQSDQLQMLQFISQVKPSHISLYILEINEGSYLYRHQNQFSGYVGKFQNYQKISRHLSLILGYNHYQVSNFCQPAYHSLHNRAYWEGDKQFAAFGMGATSLTNNMRITRPKNLSKYYKYIQELQKREKQQKILQKLQINDEKQSKQKLKWIILSRLRKKQGIRWQQIKKYLQPFNKQYIQIEENKIKNTLNQIDKQKKNIIDLHWIHDGIRLITPLGYLYTDYIGYKIIDCLNL